MGISISFLDFFDICHQQNAFQGPMMALGSLTVNDPPGIMEEFKAAHSYWKNKSVIQVRELFSHRYQLEEYRDCDINDKADLNLDLSKPLPRKWKNSVATILNGGTLEHVFNAAQALENIHFMTRNGGTIIHLAPLTWFEHAFYNFGPKTFSLPAQSNGYQMVAEAFWSASELFPAAKKGWRRILPLGNEVQPPHSQIYITHDQGGHTSLRDPIFRLFSQNFIPAQAVYMVAYRKTTSKAFIPPYDYDDGE